MTAVDITPSEFTVHATMPPQSLASVSISGSWIAVGSAPAVMIPATAKYAVLTVIYAPPGTDTKGGPSKSFVAYASTSQYGTKTSASQTFKQNYSIEATVGGGVLGTGGEAGLSFAYGRSATDSQSLEVTNSSSSALSQPAPPVDGISHDRDRICLLLNPTINLAVTSSSVSWTFQGTNAPNILCPYVGWLNGHVPWEKAPKDTLDAAHINAEDYATIVKRDLLADVATNVDPSTVDANRYKYRTEFEYSPPLQPGDPQPVVNCTFDTSTISTVESDGEDDFKVGLSIAVGADVLGIATTKLKTSDTWEWTNKSSSSTSVVKSESASATIGGPASGYVGSTRVGVYYDTVYRTFAFSMMPVQPLLAKGLLLSATGAALPATEVTLSANGISYHTFTNGKGEYKFFGVANGAMQLQANGAAATNLEHAEPNSSIELHLK